MHLSTLYYGDNLGILRDEKRIPSESVDLCYIDPPFNSQRTYNQIYSTPKKTDAAQAHAFTDMWTWDTAASLGFNEIVTNEGGRFNIQAIELFRGLNHVIKGTSLLAYLVSITLRLVEIHRLLKPTGSFYLHCDPTASHYLKIVLDAIFGPENFRSDITWKRTNVHSDSKDWSAVADTLLYYVRDAGSLFTWNQTHLSHSAEYLSSKYRHKDAKGVYRLDNMTSPNPRPNMMYEWKGFPSPAMGWRYSRETMAKLDAEGRIDYPADKHKRPQLKRYLETSKGILATNIWTDIPPINSQAQERMGYPTQKPEALLERIINASSNEGDTVLDAYCGCGTTVAVAQRLKRNWIGMDITYQSISLILKRLEDSFGETVVKAIRVDGIPFDMESATALATREDDRTRKEFEKWAVLTFTNNRATIRVKKGADKGIDGVLHFSSGLDVSDRRAVLQVKSGNVQRKDIATLHGDMEREEAHVGFLITLEEPTKPMREEAAHSGVYHDPVHTKSINRIQIVTIREILEEGKRFDLPMATRVLKTAPSKKQHKLTMRDETEKAEPASQDELPF